MLAERAPRSAHRFARTALALVLGLLAVTLPFVSPAPASAAPGPVRLAVAVPLVVPQTSTGLISSEDLARYTASAGTLTRQLDAVAGRTVAVGIDPMILASIRVLGTDAPASATAWLERLADIPNETFALAYADTDLTLATQSGHGTVPVPESFDFALDPARFDTDTAPTPTPSPTANPTVPSYPTTESLLAWDYTIDNLAWPRANSVIDADVPALVASGYERLLLDSGNLSLPAGAAATATVQGVPTLVSDAAVSADLRAAVRTVGDLQPAVATLASTIAGVGAAQSGERATVLATLDRSVPLSTHQLSTVLGSLQLDPNIELVHLSAVAATAAVEASITPQPQPEERTSLVSQMMRAAEEEARALVIAADPEAIVAQRRLAEIGLLGNAWEQNTTWSNAVDDFLDRSVELRTAVQVVASSSVNLVADNGILPVAVSNALPQPVTVYVNVRPVTPLIAIGEQRVELVVPAGSQASAPIPVQSISNGEVDLEITLTDALGGPVGSMAVVEVTVNAGWETPVIVVLAVIVVLVFGLGIVRNIVRRRKENREFEEGDTATDD